MALETSLADGRWKHQVPSDRRKRRGVPKQCHIYFAKRGSSLPMQRASRCPVVRLAMAASHSRAVLNTPMILHWFNGAFVSANRIPKRDQNPLWCIGGTMRYQPASSASAAVRRNLRGIENTTTAVECRTEPGPFSTPFITSSNTVRKCTFRMPGGPYLKKAAFGAWSRLSKSVPFKVPDPGEDNPGMVSEDGLAAYVSIGYKTIYANTPHQWIRLSPSVRLIADLLSALLERTSPSGLSRHIDSHSSAKRAGNWGASHPLCCCSARSCGRYGTGKEKSALSMFFGTPRPRAVCSLCILNEQSFRIVLILVLSR
jgi:hypothetical protein